MIIRTQLPSLLLPRRHGFLSLDRPPQVLPASRRHLVGVARAVVTAARGVVDVERLGSSTVGVNTTSTHTSDSLVYTVPSGSELVVLLVMLGGISDAPLSSLGWAHSSGGGASGSASILIGSVSGGSRGTRPGHAIAWFVPPLTGVAYTFTYTSSANMDYSAISAHAFAGVETADPIGASQSFCEDVNVNTLTRQITTQKARSILLTAGAWQGADTVPLVANHGASLIGSSGSTGASTSLDAGYAYAEEFITTTAGTYDYGFSAAVADGHGIAAVEIRGAG